MQAPLLRKIKNGQAIAAIIQGCKNHDTVYELEPLGVTNRTTGLLEQNNILYLAELILLHYEELSALKDVAEACSQSIVRGLSKYHLLESQRLGFIQSFFVCPEYLRGEYDYLLPY